MKKIQDIQVNDILYSQYWSNNTILSFYQVVKKTAKTVTIKEVKTKIENNNQSYAEVKAIKNDFVNDKTFRRKITSLSNDFAIRFNDFEYLYICNENQTITESNY